jgi:MFS family permease
VTSAETIRQPGGAFAALSSRSYRIYIGGQSLANMGSWMQSIAQDWLIFNLTHSSTAVGVTMALQFLPMLLLGLHAGAVADRLPKRRILLTTQTLNACATATLAVIAITGAARAADVYAFALLSGLIFAFDVPARQAFVTEVVPEGQLRAGIALNAAVFQATRLIGPAIASLLIVSVGTGWVFAVNAACYLGPTIGLLLLRPADLHPTPPTPRAPGAVRTAARYLRRRPDVLWTIFLVGMVGTFGLNFPIVLTAMAKSTFRGDASTYGLFNIVLGLGSAAGAVLAGAGTRPRTRIIVGSAAVFGLLQATAALTPDIGAFLVLLAAMGFVNLVCQAMANASVQLAVDPELRGRVMGLYMLVFIGGTPIGAPIIGAITSHFGARAGMGVCGVVPVLAAVVAAAGIAGSRRRRARDATGMPTPVPVPVPSLVAGGFVPAGAGGMGRAGAQHAAVRYEDLDLAERVRDSTHPFGRKPLNDQNGGGLLRSALVAATLGEAVDDQADTDAGHPDVLGQRYALLGRQQAALLAHAGRPGVQAEQAAGERRQARAGQGGRDDGDQQRRAERDLGYR